MLSCIFGKKTRLGDIRIPTPPAPLLTDKQKLGMFLKTFANSNSIDMILENSAEMIDEHTYMEYMSTQDYDYGKICKRQLHWINLSNSLKCRNSHLSSYCNTYTFTYNGNILCAIHLRNDNFCDPINVYIPSKIDDASYESQSIAKISNLQRCSITNDDYDFSVLYPLIRKCLESLYKKAFIRNKRRLQKLDAANNEISKQKKIRIDRQMAHAIEFAKEYDIDQNFID
ncbi:MAG: hypothetical protein WC979_02125 [Candidatus Pacearchaeota archaeon]|jgi:hypothetical protein|nr:hypothetical protein [Clostridia bacterium]